MTDDGDAGVVRTGFSATDTDVAEHFLRGSYADAKLTIVGARRGFTFEHSTVATPRFASNRLTIGVDTVAESLTRPDDALIVIHPVAGRLAYSRTQYPDVDVAAGALVLVPPNSPMRVVSEDIDLAMMQLDVAAVAGYAAATAGIEPDDLAFHAVGPLTPSMGRFWIDTVAHVRDDVLGDPWAAGSPILLEQASRTLAAALLSTFPNTALDRATDPQAPHARGEVSGAVLREVVDFLDAHADQPIGPTEIAEHTDEPYREVTEGLRRRDGRHPAELLWAARMRGVHRDLLDANPGVVTLADRAARWGFTSSGRFRLAYMQTFGEPPEQTLRR